MLTYKINDHIELRLEAKKTNIYVNGSEFIQCAYLLLDLPVNQIGHEEALIENIDEAGKKYSRKMEHDHTILTPEQEFWGHCSNLQVWVENDYNPNLLHSNLAVPLLKELALEDKKIFHSLLWHLDDNWNMYKTKDRRKFAIDKYSYLICSAIKKYNIPPEEYMLSTFVGSIFLIEAMRNAKIRAKRKLIYLKKKHKRRVKSKFYYWEKKLYGKNLALRHLTRAIRERDQSTIVSDPSGYLPYVVAKNSIKAGRISYVLDYKKGESFDENMNLIIDEDGNLHAFTKGQLK